MSHLTHKDIINKWNQYEQSQLKRLRKRKRTYEFLETISFLYIIGLISGTFFTNNLKEKYLLLANTSIVSSALAYTEAKKQKYVQQEKQKILQDRQHFFNQFRP